MLIINYALVERIFLRHFFSVDVILYKFKNLCVLFLFPLFFYVELAETVLSY